MALNNISELSTTPGSNTDFAGTSILGTGLVSTADDSFRNLGSFLAKQWSDLGAVNTVGGTANAIAVTTPTVYGSLKTGMFFYFTAALINTSAVTINLDSLGAKAARVASDGTDIALIPGDLRAKGRYLAIYDATANSAAGAWIIINAESNARYAPGTLYGLTLSNNGSYPNVAIDIAAGACRSAADTGNIDLLSALTQKDLTSLWSAGGGGGLLDTGAVANTTYHIYLIKRPDTGVVDAIASTSASAPTLPTNYTLYRRIGSIIRSGGAIKQFIQWGDKFMWLVPVSDVSAASPGTSAVTRTLTVPSGIKVEAIVEVAFNGSAQTDNPAAVYISDLSLTDTAALLPTGPLSFATYSGTAGVVMASGTVVRVVTNTSAQVRSRCQISGAGFVLDMNTEGWIDQRGRLF